LLSSPSLTMGLARYAGHNCVQVSRLCDGSKAPSHSRLDRAGNLPQVRLLDVALATLADLAGNDLLVLLVCENREARCGGRGELSPAAVDRGWPHQVAMPAKISMGDGYNVVHGICEGLSLVPRGHRVIGPDDEWCRVFLFCREGSAEKLKQRFSGEWFDSAKRGNGGSSMTIWEVVRE
jgi:hypothetical protein